MRRLLTIAVFGALIACLHPFISDQQRAIELVSIAFFAAFGTLDGTFDLAQHWLARRAGAVPAPVFEPWRQPRLLLIWPLCGLGLASGGGIIRRSIEIGVAAAALAWWDVHLRNCYDPPLTVFWAWGHPYFWAAGIGVALGAVLAFALTFRTSDAAPIQSRIQDLIRALDRLVSAFFAAYGIEAALKFSAALSVDVAPGPWSKFGVMLQIALFAIVAGMLMASGGGLFKRILTNLLLLRPRNILCEFYDWLAVPTLYLYGSIAIFGLLLYVILDRSLTFGNCPSINTQYMFLTMLTCAGVGFCAYVMLED
ncbi:hypothetical protein [Bradyrhizobium sp.]|uniref:hypothetical protein n=1 Tax=Bradyrhizobium sp. TaxID=376 RepID=UPI002D3035AC|nr:hypothetical protein [Bradyrhizobium sp.]HZR72668.1 hypothetical protein [Bradyrhizobium sp.]